MNEPTRIIAIRHGETAWNVDTRIQGQLDIGLNDMGRWQAHRLALALAGEAVAAIYSSDLLRAWDTAISVGDAVSREVTTDEALRKREPAFAPEGGESLIDFRERITAAVDRLAMGHAGKQIVLVAHGGVMDVLYRAATRQEIQAPRTWDLGNATINRLLWTPDGLSIVGWADNHHLDDTTLDESTA
jgi:probable phosphoglycerate mutase